MSEQTYLLGVDIGSTTVKVAIMDRVGALLYSEYQRHFAKIQETLAEILHRASQKLGNIRVEPAITGSGGMALADAMEIPFVQEVIAVSESLDRRYPQTDVAIELGGEDAKILYLTGGRDQRMNGICAGGTGSFIDQMAALLNTDAAGLNEYAKGYKRIYPIAARCGVFAKSDLQPLINEGVAKEDLAVSIFQAVVNQTISGLAQGRPIRGNVAFLGGPLHFMPELQKAFARTLKLTPEQTIVPENSHLFAAMGSIQYADANLPDRLQVRELDDLAACLSDGVPLETEIKRLPPLFQNEAEYQEFLDRHAQYKIKRADLTTAQGKCYLGIDAGSTTTKLALINEHGDLLWSFYESNEGSPLNTVIRAMAKLQQLMPEGLKITYSCSTGYGEQLLKEALQLDEGEVETIAHTTAALFFDHQVDCVLDIGGQDMKCIKIRDGVVDSITLNEACSSGCGSFLESFANSLGLTAQEFASEALYAQSPVDLGTRCTVFMNSNVKQAQKEGASLGDISAGLSYSVVKNALYKVLKCNSPRDLGEHIVVQGGTFYNNAVLRCFENIFGEHVIRPDIAGIMGAFGAALIAMDRCHNRESRMLSFEQIQQLTWETRLARCGRCENNCQLTISIFPGGRRFITGNRCEKGLGDSHVDTDTPNLMKYKFERIFGYEPLPADKAPRGVLGIPRVLNMYENYPFWATFLKELGFSVLLSPQSSRSIYEMGMESIPSESECYPAKLSHGHVEWLIAHGVDRIFYPCVYYERKEDPNSQNHFNCPMVMSYPENLKNNIEDLWRGTVKMICPFVAFSDEITITERLKRVMAEEFGIDAAETAAAAAKAWAEQLQAKEDIRKKGEEVLAWVNADPDRHGIVLAGRPYHCDPEVNHGIPEMIASYGLAVLTEDSIAHLALEDEDYLTRPLRVTDQWTYHSRLYAAASYVRRFDNLDLVQLNSFGCGVDAVTTDEVQEILTKSGKLYTLLKIDEVNNLGAARIRIRSLIAAINMRKENGIVAKPVPTAFHRAVFTKEMKEQGYTLLCPQMSPIHFELLEPIFKKEGYNIELLESDNRSAIDTGLKLVNNDACYPSLITIGQIMAAVLSGKYDTHKLAILMSQTGGGCRASNYVAFIRLALEKVGMEYIPVISVNMNGMEKNDGFTYTPTLVVRAAQAVAYGDAFQAMLYRVRPYELVPGSANALHEKWKKIVCESLVKDGFGLGEYRRNIKKMVQEFDELPLRDIPRKNRVGVVGEILVKYMPLANNHLVDVLESEGAEAVVPELLGFFEYCFENSDFKAEYLGGSKKVAFVSNLGIRAVEWVRGPITKAFAKSRRFTPPTGIKTLRKCAEPYLSAGNQCGEGWFLAGEMVELVKSGVPNIVCVQPFGCLPNHIVGKGVMRSIQRDYPEANMIAVDYDPGASEVNQLNRIKLMLTAAARGQRPVEMADGGRISGGSSCSGSCSGCSGCSGAQSGPTVAVGIGYREPVGAVKGKYDL